tara:strand:+ start:351 stop:812 length:462 start_codon:yes stop_codon:yes gene_type:complete
VIGREEAFWIVAPLVLAYVLVLISSNTVRLEQILAPALIGILIDSSLTLAGVFQFPNTTLFLPLWMIVLWISFSTSLTNSLHFLEKRNLTTSVVGCIAFPLNYLAGKELGAVAFGHDYLLTAIGLCLLWAAFLPILFFSTQFHLNKIREFIKY